MATIESGTYWNHQQQLQPHSASQNEDFQDALLDELATVTGISIL